MKFTICLQEQECYQKYELITYVDTEIIDKIIDNDVGTFCVDLIDLQPIGLLTINKLRKHLLKEGYLIEQLPASIFTDKREASMTPFFKNRSCFCFEIPEHIAAASGLFEENNIATISVSIPFFIHNFIEMHLNVRNSTCEDGIETNALRDIDEITIEYRFNIISFLNFWKNVKYTSTITFPMAAHFLNPYNGGGFNV